LDVRQDLVVPENSRATLSLLHIINTFMAEILPKKRISN
jgi:hypothetical protein